MYVYIHWACMYTEHACSGAGTRAVPYRGRAPRFANHGSVIECIYIKPFIAKINVRFMDRSLNACTELEIVRKVFETNGMP